MSVKPGGPSLDASSESHPRARHVRSCLELFGISFLILFLELGWIRWLGSTVTFLAFFTNIVLIGCFLGVSVGALAAARTGSWIKALIPLGIVIAGSASGFLWIYQHYAQVMVEVGSQQSPQLIYFGTDARVRDPSKWVVPIEVIAGYFFALVAFFFVGLGQEMGRRFAAINNRLAAYMVNTLGSMAGIGVFGALAFLRAPAWSWFVIALGTALPFIPTRRLIQTVGALAVIGLVMLADWPNDPLGAATEVIWSPYYQVRYKPRYLSIDVNNMGHQGMLPVDRAGPAYLLPHLLNRDSGQRPFDDVLIIGAGSGNDVAAAVTQGAGHVDAVEIDPVINALGKLHHPNHPYRDPRVDVHLEDGRGFIRKTSKHYDMIVYALLDSLALHSSYSSVRLESFLFTEQAFRDVKAKLKPDGVFALYNFYRRGWVLCRIVRLLEQVFGTKPIVITLPFQPVVTSEDNQGVAITFVLAGDGASRTLAAIQRNSRPRSTTGSIFSRPRVQQTMASV